MFPDSVSFLKNKLQQGLSVDTSYNPDNDLKVAFSPTPNISQPSTAQPSNISLAQSQPTPTIKLNTAQAPTVAPPVNPSGGKPSWSTPPAPPPNLLHGIVEQAINPASKFLNEITALGEVIKGNQKGAAKTLAPGGGLGHQGGVLGGKELGKGAVFIGPGAIKNIEKTVGTGAQLGSYGIGGVGALRTAPLGTRIVQSALGGSAANALGSVGQQLADTGKIQLRPTLESAAAGAVIGGVLPVGGAVIRRGVELPKNEAGAIGKNIAGEPEPKIPEQPYDMSKGPPDFLKPTASQLRKGEGVRPEDITTTDRIISPEAPEKVAGARVLSQRNADAERAALEHLRGGGIRDEAIKIYQQVSGESPRMSAYRVKLVAREANQALRPNVRGENPLSGTMNLPAGDAKQAVINRQRVNSLIDANANQVRQDFKYLTPNDRSNFIDYVQGTKDWHTAENPETLSDAMISSRKLFDTTHELDRSAGGGTDYIRNFFPDYWNYENPQTASKLEELKASRPSANPFTENYGGYHAKDRVFANRQEGLAAGFEPLNADPLQDIERYVTGAKLTVGNQTLKKTVGQIIYEGQPRNTVDLPDGSDIKVSDDVYKVLKNVDTKDPRNIIGKIYDTADKPLKQILVGLSTVHSLIINVLKAYPAAFGLSGDLRGVGRATLGLGKSYAAYVKPSTARYMAQRDLEDGITDFGARIGSPIHTPNLEAGAGTKFRNPISQATFGRSLPTMHSYLLRNAKDYLDRQGVNYDSQAAKNLGKAVNNAMGYVNTELQGRSIALRPTFAPQLVRSTFSQFLDLFKGRQAFRVAASALIGGELMIQGMGALSKYISNEIDQRKGKKKSPDNVVSTFWRELLTPSLYTPFTNDKGENINLGIPGQYWQKVEGIFANVHRGADGQLTIGANDFKQAISKTSQSVRGVLSPLTSGVLTAGTGKNYAGVKVRDPNAPLGQQAAQTAINVVSGEMPINLEGFVSSNIQKHLPQTLQGAIKINNTGGPLMRFAGNTFGLNPKIDVTQGYAAESGKYFQASSDLQDKLRQGRFGDIDPSLKGIDGQLGPYFHNQWLAIHPQDTTDLSGTKYKTPYNPVGAEARYNAYTYTDPKTGQRILSPVFYVDKQLQTATSGYPSSPLYKLSGNGTDVDGNQSSKALVALEYQNSQDPGAKTVIMNANGGENGWLSKYENDLGNYSQNYQTNLTNYFKDQGWNQKAVDQYWQNHPSIPDPIAAVNFDKPTTDLLTQYYQLLATGDSTSSSKFFSEHAGVLGAAFDQMAQHANALREARGQLQLQGFPPESDHVKQVFAAMPKGSDIASKAARGRLINNNPDVNQFLADMGLYEVLSKGAQFRYKNPANMSATEAQNINAGGLAGQSFMKNLVNVGKYDIGKNAAGAFSFMQSGGFPAGATAGGGAGGSRRKPFVPRPARLKAKRVKLRRAPHQRGGRPRLAKQQRKLNIAAPPGLRPVRVARPAAVLKIRA